MLRDFSNFLVYFPSMTVDIGFLIPHLATCFVQMQNFLRFDTLSVITINNILAILIIEGKIIHTTCYSCSCASKSMNKYTVAQVHGCTITQMCKYSDVQVHKCTSTMMYEYSYVRVHICTSIQNGQV